jgi:hypothetical protein
VDTRWQEVSIIVIRKAECTNSCFPLKALISSIPTAEKNSITKMFFWFVRNRKTGGDSEKLGIAGHVNVILYLWEYRDEQAYKFRVSGETVVGQIDHDLR